jgi:hypothetical protein
MCVCVCMCVCVYVCTHTHTHTHTSYFSAQELVEVTTVSERGNVHVKCSFSSTCKHSRWRQAWILLLLQSGYRRLLVPLPSGGGGGVVGLGVFGYFFAGGGLHSVFNHCRLRLRLRLLYSLYVFCVCVYTIHTRVCVYNTYTRVCVYNTYTHTHTHTHTHAHTHNTTRPHQSWQAPWAGTQAEE